MICTLFFLLLLSSGRWGIRKFKAISFTVGFLQSKTALFDWIFFRLESSGPSSYRQSSRFYSVVLFLEAVGVREYCCTTVEIGWQLCASRFLREQRLDEPSPQRVGGFGLRRKPPKLQQAQPLLAAWDRYRALLPSYDTRCWRAELGMLHADLLREATAVIATPASAPCRILQCGTWYGCVAVWPCGCVFGGGMNDAIGSENTCKTFSTEFFDWIRQSEFSVEKVESKKPCPFSTV